SETATAPSASAPPTTRPGVTATTPAGPTPSRSSTRPCTVCPATTPTVNSDTPSTPAVSPCVETVSAPQAPPNSIQVGMVRDRTPRHMRTAPARAEGRAPVTMTRRIRPTPNETRPATMPSSRRTPRTPLILAWIAVIAPIETAPPRATGAGRGRVRVTRAPYPSGRPPPARVGGRRYPVGMCASYGLDPRFTDAELLAEADAEILDGLREWAQHNDGQALRPTGKNPRNLNPLVGPRHGSAALEPSWWGYLVDGQPARFPSINTRSERLQSRPAAMRSRAIVPAT